MSEFQVVFVDNQTTYICMCTYAYEVYNAETCVVYIYDHAQISALWTSCAYVHIHIYVCWLSTNTT